MNWSLVLNFISVPAAIILGLLSYRLSLHSSRSQKVEELASVEGQVGRVASIEVARIAGRCDYGTLIREHVLNVATIDNIASKCKKHGLNGAELHEFLREANSALANRYWEREPADRLIRRARNLQKRIGDEMRS
ncbi:hypothetical protein Q5L94_08585 [Idiomarina sp. Sol25]|uniref:hypothetical protein n=1 Tax=Idiomarina sp. Sol25 TaxID=3064000 RepID=UPI00294B77F5|nr:hypothetical protein [Idiomarina sp. Sol25]MDV6328113.1 hypothetical protein [Idiomarina sp. Sol25]